MSEQFPSTPSQEISQKNQELYAAEKAAIEAYEDIADAVASVEEPSDALLDEEVHAATTAGDAIEASDNFAAEPHVMATLEEEARIEDVERAAAERVVSDPGPKPPETL